MIFPHQFWWKNSIITNFFMMNFNFGAKIQKYRKIIFSQNWIFRQKEKTFELMFCINPDSIIKSKKIQIWYFDRDTIISQKKSTKNYWKNIGGKYKMKIELGEGVTKIFLKILIFCLAQLNFCLFFLFICWCCYYYYYWFQIPWYLLFYKTKYKAHCWHSVLKPWIRSWIW